MWHKLVCSHLHIIIIDANKQPYRAFLLVGVWVACWVIDSLKNSVVPIICAVNYTVNAADEAQQYNFL